MAPLLPALLLLALAFAPGLAPRRVALDMKSERLANGMVARVEARLFFDLVKKRMVGHYTYPREYVYLSDEFGQVQIYFPSANQVSRQSSPMFSSKSHPVFYFLSGQTYDMGLKDLGFTLLESRREGALQVVRWLAPARLQDQLQWVELVHQDNLPIYMGYLALDGSALKKVYFTRYHRAPGVLPFPTRITEVEYGQGTDSVVNRFAFENPLFDAAAQSPYFDFAIPADAKSLD